MDLRQIKILSEIVRTGGFRAAADAMNLSQSGVSQAINSLERELGSRLLDRTTRRVSLSLAGEAFLFEAENSLRAAERAKRMVHLFQRGEKGPVSIAYNDFGINGDVPLIIKNFRSKSPDVELHLRFMSTSEQLAAIYEGELDIAFLTGEHKEPWLRTHKVSEFRYFAVLPASHRLAKTKSVKMTDLAAEPFILGERRTWYPFHNMVMELCRRANFEPRIVQEAPSGEGIVGLVKAEVGVTITAECIAQITRDHIVYLPLSDVSDRVSVNMATHQHVRSPTTSRFFDYAAQITDRADACITTLST